MRKIPTTAAAKPDGRTTIVIEVYEAPDGFRWRERRAGRTLRDNYTRRRDAHRAVTAFVDAIRNGDYEVVNL